MIFQYSIEGFEWVLGLGIVFGLAFVFTMLTEQDLTTFFIFLCAMDTFAVMTGLLPFWTLVVFIIILVILIYMKLSEKGGNG